MFALALDASLTFLCDGGNVAAPGQLGSRYPFSEIPSQP